MLEKSILKVLRREGDEMYFNSSGICSKEPSEEYFLHVRVADVRPRVFSYEFKCNAGVNEVKTFSEDWSAQIEYYRNREQLIDYVKRHKVSNISLVVGSQTGVWWISQGDTDKRFAILTFSNGKVELEYKLPWRSCEAENDQLLNFFYELPVYILEGIVTLEPTPQKNTTLDFEYCIVTEYDSVEEMLADPDFHPESDVRMIECAELTAIFKNGSCNIDGLMAFKDMKNGLLSRLVQKVK